MRKFFEGNIVRLSSVSGVIRGANMNAVYVFGFEVVRGGPEDLKVDGTVWFRCTDLKDRGRVTEVRTSRP